MQKLGKVNKNTKQKKNKFKTSYGNLDVFVFKRKRPWFSF
jgi:hypothetical protein